jgi:hypothetical protein
LRKQLGFTPEAEDALRALEQAEQANLPARIIDYRRQRLSFELGLTDQEPAVPTPDDLAPRKPEEPTGLLADQRQPDPPAAETELSAPAPMPEPPVSPPEPSLFDRLPPEIRDSLTEEEAALLPFLVELYPPDGNPKGRRTATFEKLKETKAPYSESVYDRLVRKMKPFWGRS